jgi:hypothetical protein
VNQREERPYEITDRGELVEANESPLRRDIRRKKAMKENRRALRIITQLQAQQ